MLKTRQRSPVIANITRSVCHEKSGSPPHALTCDEGPSEGLLLAVDYLSFGEGRENPIRIGGEPVTKKPLCLTAHGVTQKRGPIH